jgi:hypothetical protein
MLRASMLALIAIFGLCLRLQLQTAQAQSGQDEGTKQIDVQLSPGNYSMWEPVWITRVAIGSQFLLNAYDPYNLPLPGEITPGRDFTAGDNWLRETTLEVINRTNQPIAWLSIKLMFPQTGDGRTQPVWVYPIGMGRIPDADAFDRNGKPFPPEFLGTKSLGLQPGARLTIHLSDYADKIAEYLKTAMPLTLIDEVRIYVDGCEFEDGLRFTGGAFSRPDPQRPGQWIYMHNRQYFPGNSHQYLPNVVTRRGDRPQQ